jgi:hypothetical protein
MYQIHDLRTLIGELKRIQNVQYISDSNVIEFDGTPELFQKLEPHFAGEIVRTKTIRINSYQPNLTLFIDSSDFERRVKESDFKRDVFILNLETTSFLYTIKDEVTYRDFEPLANDFSIQNADYYYKFLQFLKSQEHKEDQPFYFVDNFSWDNRIIVFSSLKREGRLSIPFSARPPRLSRGYQFRKRYKRFVSAFEAENRQMPKFIKAELFAFLSKEERDGRMESFIRKIDEILDIAGQNHELYISEISLENIKKEYQEHIEKYFQSLRDILGKISTQIIGMPLSITAAAFATYKSIDSLLVLIIIVAVFVIYTIYMIFIVRLQRQDVFEVKTQANSDYKKISTGDFFVRHPEEIFVFDKVMLRLKARIGTLEYLIGIFYFTLLLTNALFVEFLFDQIHGAPRYVSVIGLTGIGIIIWLNLEHRLRRGIP